MRRVFCNIFFPQILYRSIFIQWWLEIRWILRWKYMDKCLHILRAAFVRDSRDLVDGWMVDRGGCHGDHVGSQLNKCRQELEQPLRHRRPSLLALLVYVNGSAFLSPSLSSWYERVSIVARVVRHAKFEPNSARVRFASKLHLLTKVTPHYSFIHHEPLKDANILGIILRLFKCLR